MAPRPQPAWAHLPAVEVENPQPEREVGLHGWGALGATAARLTERTGGRPCPAPHSPTNASRGRLPRYRDNRPSAYPERRSAANPGRAARDRRQSWGGSRVNRSRLFGSSAGCRDRGLRVPGLALARLHQQQAQS